jgi:hypothetical protein
MKVSKKTYAVLALVAVTACRDERRKEPPPGGQPEPQRREPRQADYNCTAPACVFDIDGEVRLSKTHLMALSQCVTGLPSANQAIWVLNEDNLERNVARPRTRGAFPGDVVPQDLLVTSFGCLDKLWERVQAEYGFGRREHVFVYNGAFPNMLYIEGDTPRDLSYPIAHGRVLGCLEIALSTDTRCACALIGPMPRVQCCGQTGLDCQLSGSINGTVPFAVARR